MYNLIIYGLFKTSYVKYIFNMNLYKVYWCKKNHKIIMKYNDEYYNTIHLQNELIVKSKEKMKEINELEKACVGVSVMIDNV